MRDVRFVRLAIVNGAQRRGYSVRSKAAVTDGRYSSAGQQPCGIHYCGSQPQRLQRAGQTFFDLVNQPGNIDRLGERTMPFDAETVLCLRHGD